MSNRGKISVLLSPIPPRYGTSSTDLRIHDSGPMVWSIEVGFRW